MKDVVFLRTSVYHIAYDGEMSLLATSQHAPGYVFYIFTEYGLLFGWSSSPHGQVGDCINLYVSLYVQPVVPRT